MSAPSALGTNGSNARAELVDSAVDHVLSRGFGDSSLRAMAAELGTSHRMLIYHFGSAQGFWDAVLQALQRRDQEAMALATDGRELPTLEETWAQLTTGPSLSIFRVLFQLYGEALADPEAYADFLDHFVDRWLASIERGLRERAGKSRAQARVHARLNLAIIRGLMLDLLTTGDLKGTTAALHSYARMARGDRARRT
ncbi:MAG: TetR/AcrR family transcriptional regulator [Myxococcales bacterium]|jgi:AcrR family transcriptional regulator